MLMKIMQSRRIARITSATLAAQHQAADPNDPAWRTSLPTYPGEAVRRDLETRLGDNATKVRDLLRPLAFAEGQGLPWEDIWAAVAARAAGTTYTDDDRLAEEDVLVAVATGGRPLDSLPPLPPNARAAEFLPYDELLPKTGVYVVNGGYGGVQYALRHGVPIVAAGHQEDKPEVVARVAWAGVGRRITARVPTGRGHVRFPPAEVREQARDRRSELDRLKESKNKHVRWRAAHTLGVLDELFLDGSPSAKLRATRVEILFDPPGHSRLAIEDDEIVDRAVAAQALAYRPGIGRNVVLLTYDTGQASRGRRADLDVRKLPPATGGRTGSDLTTRRLVHFHASITAFEYSATP
ncbi:hypothetical protein PV458_25775 [Streptomyces sp. MN03-5084-2B]|nr:hypothetical protein [Streptomyces sp. MN03-5084-2B]